MPSLGIPLPGVGARKLSGQYRRPRPCRTRTEVEEECKKYPTFFDNITRQHMQRAITKHPNGPTRRERITYAVRAGRVCDFPGGIMPMSLNAEAVRPTNPRTYYLRGIRNDSTIPLVATVAWGGIGLFPPTSIGELVLTSFNFVVAGGAN